MKPWQLDMKFDKFVPIPGSEDIPVRPAIKSATERAIIALLNAPAPTAQLSSAILIPVTNGVTLVMNIDKLVPTAGS